MSNNTNTYYLDEMEQLAKRKAKLANRKKRYYENKERIKSNRRAKSQRFNEYAYC